MSPGPQSAVRSPQKVLRAPGSPTIEPVADGVWLIRGGLPRTMNVYLLEESGDWDSAMARESARKIAALEPATAWAGHGEPLRGDVRGQIERFAS